MTMGDQTCSAFIDVLASKVPVPGGGGGAAKGGAIVMALSNMVGNLTVGKKKYADVEGEMKELIVKGEEIISKLKSLGDKDAEVDPIVQKISPVPAGVGSGTTWVLGKQIIMACKMQNS